MSEQMYGVLDYHWYAHIVDFLSKLILQRLMVKHELQLTSILIWTLLKKKTFPKMFKLFFNHSGMVLALSKGPEHPDNFFFFFNYLIFLIFFLQIMKF